MVYDLAHVSEWGPYNLHDVGHVSWVGIVLRVCGSCTPPHAGRLRSRFDLVRDLSGTCELFHDIQLRVQFLSVLQYSSPGHVIYRYLGNLPRRTYYMYAPLHHLPSTCRIPTWYTHTVLISGQTGILM